MGLKGKIFDMAYLTSLLCVQQEEEQWEPLKRTGTVALRKDGRPHLSAGWLAGSRLQAGSSSRATSQVMMGTGRKTVSPGEWRKASRPGQVRLKQHRALQHLFH